MTRIIKKYTILIVASIVLARLLTASILFIWPDLLTIRESEISVRIIGSEYLEYGISYLLNIVLVFILFKEMKKEKVQSIPILILTFFSSLLGVIFILLIIAFNRYNNKQINQYE